MMEATETIRANHRQAGPGFDLTIAYIKEEQYPFLCSGNSLIDRALLGKVPGSQRTMTKQTAFRVPYRLHLGACLGRTPASAGQSLGQLFRQCTASTVSDVDCGQRRQEALIAYRVEGGEFCQSLADHVLQKGNGGLAHALVHGFRRDVHRL